MVSAADARSRQRAWAKAQGISVDRSGYVANVEENLFVRISPETREELSYGSGNELGGSGRRGKMQALHSSSALAYNVFEYWRQQEDREALRRALGLPTRIELIGFEGKFSTGLGAPAHIDVVLEVGDELVAVESKFLEPFGSSQPYATFSNRYFPPGLPRWTEVGLPGCQALAEQVSRGDLEFLRLDVPQLLKHALGLWRVGRTGVSLWYVYLEMEGEVGERHKIELDRFREMVGEEVGFTALSYDRVFSRLQDDAGAAHDQYVTYLANRYGGGN